MSSQNGATQTEGMPRERKNREKLRREPLVFYEDPQRNKVTDYGYVCERCGNHNSRSARQCAVCGFILPT